jgi:hypothetical protein
MAGSSGIHYPQTQLLCTANDRSIWCYPRDPSNTPRSRTTRAASFPGASSCAHIRSTFHPSRRSSRLTVLSRWRFRCNLASQYVLFDRGRRKHRGHACQKHPSTKTATRSLLNTKSGRPKIRCLRRHPLIPFFLQNLQQAEFRRSITARPDARHNIRAFPRCPHVSHQLASSSPSATHFRYASESNPAADSRSAFDRTRLSRNSKSPARITSTFRIRLATSTISTAISFSDGLFAGPSFSDEIPV